jgi:hypothetical protein
MAGRVLRKKRLYCNFPRMEAPKWCVLDRRFRPSLEVLQVAIYENEFHKTGNFADSG